jgi:hypothetical protein
MIKFNIKLKHCVESGFFKALRYMLLTNIYLHALFEHVLTDITSSA